MDKAPNEDQMLAPAGVMEALGLSDRPLAQNASLRGHPSLTLRDEANVITAFAFRNGFIEELHAGEPSPLLDSPSASRITDDEMRKLMIETSALVSRWLYLREGLLEREPEQYFALVQGYARMFCRGWDRKKARVKLRKKRGSIPCFVCGEPVVWAWAFCPHCGHANG